jgi:hypothetical protein
MDERSDEFPPEKESPLNSFGRIEDALERNDALELVW